MRTKAILLSTFLMLPAFQSGAQTLSNGGFENFGGLTLSPDAEFAGAQSIRFGTGEVVPGWGTVKMEGVNDLRFINDTAGTFNNTEGNGMLFLGGGASLFARNDEVGGFTTGSYTFSMDVATWKKPTNTGLSDRPISLSGRYTDVDGKLVGTQFLINPSVTNPLFTWDKDPSGAFNSDGAGPDALNWRTLNTTFEVDYAGAPAGAVGFDLFVTAGITANDSGHLIDNVNLSKVPEPSSGMLLGLAGILALMVRRRK